LKTARRIKFTLIELLIVISIIAILTSMLLPALKKAKETTLKIKCANNQRQVGALWINYMDDYNSVFPN
jgi:prepilin-type N-terminal cleavage/methylation domain-containing protein